MTLYGTVCLLLFNEGFTETYKTLRSEKHSNVMFVINFNREIKKW